ncbi:MAG: PDZ domain-containing protein [Desulfovibrio sp.]|jgi:carboxyl-terminal processing protease|nr:PDZ domain-containing protein [Desulfovibrio sp.]
MTRLPFRLPWITVLFALLCASPSSGASSQPDTFAKLRKAAQTARQEALNPPDPASAAENAVRAYLNTIDPYSTYLTAAQYASLHAAPGEYVGVGMDIVQSPEGILYCLPFRGGPADMAGIRRGDMLFSINDTPASQYPLLVIESMIRGKRGSSIKLGVFSEAGVFRYVIARDVVRRRDVEAVKVGQLPCIRIRRFSASTVDELRSCLDSAAPDSPLVLDIRDNVGGDLKAAIAAADFFLQPGKKIAQLRDRKGMAGNYSSGKGDKARTGPLVIWQDSFTASASEVFCAALVDNKAATNVGRRSFGKGIAQRIIPAGDGDYFVITTGRLFRPDGESFHVRGIEPAFAVDSSHDKDDEAYLRRTYELIGR